MTHLLEVEGLTLRYGARAAVDGLSFAVREGEIFGLLGPNGAGKSTTFQLLTGLRAPDGGTVRLAGQPLSPASRARMGVVFQSPSLDLLLTARENLELGGALYGLPVRERRARAEELLQLVELADRAEERVQAYSGGMRRRLEIARALMHRPGLLVLDEPTSGLDEAAFQRVWAHLRALRERERLTLLVITHRAEEAEQCDRLLLLNQGRAVACAAPAELRAWVGGDVIVLAGERPEALAREVGERLGLVARVVDGEVVIEQPQGHALVPRLVEALPQGRLASVRLHPPTLADAFMHLTGRALAKEARA